PLLSFPSVSLLGCTVGEITHSAELQAKGMKAVADEVPSLASVSFMDLSVEAEAFGAEISVSETEVPSVISTVVTDMESAENLRVPSVGEKRTGVYVEAVKQAKTLIYDRPVFAGIIGPFSLAGRLCDVTETLVYCYTDPDLLHVVLEKATAFLVEYAKAYKTAGAQGVVMAEPLAGLLSPDLAEEFSEKYVKQIVDAVQDETFLVVYHNCGNSAVQIADSILRTGCAAYHFGNAIRMEDMMQALPTDTIAMGNIDPAGEFKNGTPESMKKAVFTLLDECAKYPNFVISSGCDIPPDAKWENIRAYFNAITEYYQK
ncbi:MAG: uroporphyrinogen decarboxylase family protein, partial [Clostridia bacterium]|nr:uroporphyrinogen decarboxylase family protein [Clostridia bacterium]